MPAGASWRPAAARLPHGRPPVLPPWRTEWSRWNQCWATLLTDLLPKLNDYFAPSGRGGTSVGPHYLPTYSPIPHINELPTSLPCTHGPVGRARAYGGAVGVLQMRTRTARAAARPARRAAGDRDAAEMQPRCSRDAAEMQSTTAPQCSLHAPRYTQPLITHNHAR